MKMKKNYLSDLQKAGIKLAIIYREYPIDQTSKTELKPDCIKEDLSLLKGQVFELITVDEARELDWNIMDLFTGEKIIDPKGYLVAFDNGAEGDDYVANVIRCNYTYIRKCHNDYDYMVQNPVVDQITFSLSDEAKKFIMKMY